ncbi:MAG: cation:proton antiporter [Phycisphaerae bacterium]
MPNHELSILVFLQLAAILLACRLVGWAARRLGQPQVVGEMIAGVLLGPSLFGLLAPELNGALFPAKSPSMSVLYCAAQIGLALYMFLVGVEFDVHLLRRRARAAASVSIAGMLVPFSLGALLALGLHRDPQLFAAGVSRGEAVLFLGAAMSITAFPMLARIIYERGLTGTSLGTLALAAGSMDDAAAWCVLAFVLASFTGDGGIALLAIGGGAAYALLTLTVVRRALLPLGRRANHTGTLTPTIFVVVLALLMLAAWLTDRIGIYAVFGAFILGVAMPRGRFADELQTRIEPLTTGLLLPLFFVYSGLNTRIDMLDRWALWGLAAVVLAAACLGKFGACWAAARLSGEPNRDALAVGALMNARGLMELIILNIGLERGIITPQLFSVLVMMAILTTLMATPLFHLSRGRAERGERAPTRGPPESPSQIRSRPTRSSNCR